MEVKIVLTYKGKEKSAFLSGSANVSNANLCKMINCICSYLQEQLIEENGPDEGGMNWNITWSKI